MMFQKEQMATGIFAYTAYTRNRIYIYMIHYDICIYIHTLYSNHQKGRTSNSFANILVGTYFFSIVSGVAMDLFRPHPNVAKQTIVSTICRPTSQKVKINRLSKNELKSISFE